MIKAENKVTSQDFFKEHAEWGILKFNSQEDYEKQIRYSEEENLKYFGQKEQISRFKPNILLNAGITAVLQLIGTSGATMFDNAHAYLGVGDSSTAEVATQTALQASTNKLFKAMDATYPQVSSQTITWQSTFGASDANWAWNEFGVANGSGGTVLLNRKVSAQSTKVSGQVWVLQLSMTLS